MSVPLLGGGRVNISTEGERSVLRYVEWHHVKASELFSDHKLSKTVRAVMNRD